MTEGHLLLCRAAFLQGDYAECADHASALLASGPTLEPLQLLLISLQRCGETARIPEVAAKAFEATAGDPLENALIRLTLGQADLVEVLQLARDDVQRCQARYYAAARLCTLKRPDEARVAFDACRLSPVDCLEYYLACTEGTLPVREFLPDAGAVARRQVEQDSERVEALFREGNYREALDLAEQTCRRAAEVYGEDHHEYAGCLNNLALLHQTVGNLTAGEQFFLQALRIKRHCLGERHPSFATALGNLGAFYHQVGDYARAEPLLGQALVVDRDLFGEASPEHALDLHNLAALYRATGQFTQADQAYCRAIECFRAAPGDHRREEAVSLNGLALSHFERGDPAAAEPLFRRALEIQASALGEQHPSYAATLSNLAVLYKSLGNYAAAEPLYRQVRAISLAVFREHHFRFAQATNNLGVLLKVQGDYAAAEPLLRQALQIHRALFGDEHHETITSFNNLATLHRAAGDYSQARALLLQAVQGGRRGLGEAHPLTVESLLNLAFLDHARGQTEDAEAAYREALATSRLATDNPVRRSQALTNLAGLCAGDGRPAEALRLMRQAERLDDQLLGQVFSISSERQRMAYLKDLHARRDLFLSLVAFSLPRDADATGAAMDLLLRRHGIGLEALITQREATLQGRYPELAGHLQELARLRIQIVRRTLDGPGREGEEEHRRLLANWTARQERLDTSLVQQIPEMNLERRLASADRLAVAGILPTGSVLIQFVRFGRFDFQARPGLGETRLEADRYLAFVLPAGRPDALRLIDLGEADPTDRLVGLFRGHLTRQVDEGEDRHVGGQWRREGESEQAGEALRSAIFDPLLPSLLGRDRLLICPDGDLTRLPFETIPSGGGRLIDDFRISYLSSGRDALRFGVAASGEPTAPVVAADPDFDLGAAGRTDPTVSPDGRRSNDLDRGHRAARLPGTRAEGEEIAALLGVEPLLGGDVLESRLRAVRSPRILHLATHGFFLADQARTSEAAELDRDRLGSGHWENPLLRSGLFLAGFNVWNAGGTPPLEAEDGLLTAEDVAGMDLIGTDLVVLSACDTGLGRVHAGEGVFGLRRAFELAGARTLIMSLWKVPDTQTQELMGEFYRRLLAGHERAEALRSAQLALRQRFPDPYYWGAFVCQGDPRPLIEAPPMAEEAGP